MPKHLSPRPKADGRSPIGIRRYMLLKAAFRHAQQAIEAHRYLEAIPLLESIILDRLGSLVGGSLGHDIDLQWTISRICQVAAKNVVGTGGAASRGRKAPLPSEVVAFIEGDVQRWFDRRNHAIHGMAKLHHVEDDTFEQRYAKLRCVALDGIELLLQIDKWDVELKKANNAGRSATWPDALELTPTIQAWLSKPNAQAS